MRPIVLIILFLGVHLQYCSAQARDSLKVFETPNSLDKKRAAVVGLTAGSLYGASLITVNQFWYKDYPKTSFHLFNDWGEWENMDKYGHAYSAYVETKLFYHAARWTGLSSKKSAISAFLFSSLAQASIEYFDGHSENWGWSWHDIAYNTGGGLLFSLQEYFSGQQKIKMKFSSTPISYPTSAIFSSNGSESNIKYWAEEQFGQSFAERLLKDYNAQTIWLSFNVQSIVFQNNDKFPKWINLAVGYSAENMLGAFGNNWKIGDEVFRPQNFDRYKQVLFSVDLDLERIPVNNVFLKGVLKILNIVKIPSPTLEFNSIGQQKLHWIYF